MTRTGIERFRNAGFGLFMHYGLYSLLGRGEWVQFSKKIKIRFGGSGKNAKTS